MRILIAPDKLRGTYFTGRVRLPLGAAGFRRADDSVRQMPLADGGEGTAEALCAAAGGSWRHAAVHDAAGRPLEARFALLDASTAALDVAEACGALRVADLPRDPVGRRRPAPAS